MPAQTLLSFHAGKMSRENETSNTVLPDLRKGYVQLLIEDDLLHFQWKERSATDAEDDLIIFPEDAKFMRVTEAGDGRVYMLRFESSKAKHFFWMQDKSDARDAWLIERVNTLISDPEAPATAEVPNVEENAMVGVLTGLSSHQTNRGPAVVNEDILNTTLAGFPGGADAFWEGMQGSGIGREELMQMLASELQPALRDTLLTPRNASQVSIPHTPSATQQPPLFPQSSQPPTTTSTQQNTSAEVPRSLQEQLAELTAGLPGASNTGGSSRREYVSLNDVLSRDVLNRVLQMPGVGERLRPGMPDNWDTETSGVKEVVQSPQFQQALSSLSSAISTGQLAPLLQQFGLEGGIDNVESFLRAVEDQVRREQGGGGSSSGQEGGDDERMQED